VTGMANNAPRNSSVSFSIPTKSGPSPISSAPPMYRSRSVLSFSVFAVSCGISIYLSLQRDSRCRQDLNKGLRLALI